MQCGEKAGFYELTLEGYQGFRQPIAQGSSWHCLCSQDINGITNCFLIGFKAHSTGDNSSLGTVNLTETCDWESHRQTLGESLLYFAKWTQYQTAF